MEINTDLLTDQNILKESKYSTAQEEVVQAKPPHYDLISAIMRNK